MDIEHLAKNPKGKKKSSAILIWCDTYMFIACESYIDYTKACICQFLNVHLQLLVIIIKAWLMVFAMSWAFQIYSQFQVSDKDKYWCSSCKSIYTI